MVARGIPRLELLKACALFPIYALFQRHLALRLAGRLSDTKAIVK